MSLPDVLYPSCRAYPCADLFPRHSIALLAAAAGILLPIPARGANFNISNGDVTALRNAIVQANSNNQDDTINLAAGGSYVFSNADSSAGQDGASALPAIAPDQGRRLTINGNSATVARFAAAGPPLFRLFNVKASANATISSVRILNGFPTQLTEGGGLSNAGSLTLNYCTFEESVSAIANTGSLEMTGCTVTGARSGALSQEGSANLLNCTFVNNGAEHIRNTGAVLSVLNCTFSGGAIVNSAASPLSANRPTRLTVGNSLFDGCPISEVISTGRELPETVSEGYNLSSRVNVLLTHASDLVEVMAGLDPEGLKANGGITPTIRLMADSAGIDQGYAFGVTQDQRGFPRSVNNPSLPNKIDGTDIGAFESGIEAPQSGVGGFVVNTLDDHNDGLAGGTDCTLREALLAAQTITAASPATIRFAPELAGTITLTGAAGGTLPILKAVEIEGPGARRISVNGNTNYRVFGISGSGTTRISGLSIAAGRVSAPSGQAGEGGGIYNSGTLVVSDCTFDFNRVSGGNGSTLGQAGGSGRGGAVFNAGTLTLDGCTLKNNGAFGSFGANYPPPDDFTLTTGGAGGSGFGGGVHNSSGGTLTVVNCTFTANNAAGSAGGSGHYGGAGGSGFGGAIHNLGTLVVRSSTLAGNTGFNGSGGSGRSSFFSGPAGSAAGGLSTTGGTATVRSSIVSGNTASGSLRQDIHGTFISSGFNLIGKTDGGGGFTGPGDQTGSNAAPLAAQLAPLASNGGYIDTFLPMPGSPAIDKGNNANSSGYLDQRGRGRVRDSPATANAEGGDGSDVGALEIGGTIYVHTASDNSDGFIGRSGTTLREAIGQANLEGTVSEPAWISITNSGKVVLNGEMPPISASMSITGPGSNQFEIARASNATTAFRIFTLSNNTPDGPVVSLSGLTLTGGRAPDGSFPHNCGGGILILNASLTLGDCVIKSNSSPSLLGTGGGIFNYGGSLTANRCKIEGNAAFIGGGIANHQSGPGTASSSLTDCTLIANLAEEGDGGALHNEGDGGTASLLATQCTVSGNQSSGGFGARGAVLVNRAGSGGSAAATLAHCTVAENNAAVAGGIFNHAAGGNASLTLGHTIFKSGGSTPNLVNSGGTIVSLGYNLCDDSAGGDAGTGPGGYLDGGGDLRNRDTGLGPLINRGTLSFHLPRPGSPAVDGGLGAAAAHDQRGYPRTMDSPYHGNASGGNGTDIGAVEVQPVFYIPDLFTPSDYYLEEWKTYYNIYNITLDTDGDDRTDGQEFYDRTNPRVNPFAILGIELSGNNVIITFSGVANRTMVLERSTLLTPGSWTPTGIEITPPVTGVSQVLHPGGVSGPRGFYRLRVLP